jgi:hypothetical protein
MQKPKRLFRFYSPKKIQEIVDGQLVLSSPEYFNDPFDCTPSYEEMLGELLRRAVRDQFYFSHPENGPSWKAFSEAVPLLREEVREVIPDRLRARLGTYCAVACFFGTDNSIGCDGVDSLLLWAHYGESHTGFVVEFNPEHPIFHPDNFRKVIYSKQRPEYIPEQAQAEKCLLTKSPEWLRENEYRIVMKVPGNLNRNQNGRFYIPLEPAAVKAIYLGCRSKDPLRIGIVDAAGRHSIPVYLMRRHHSEYALVSVPFEAMKRPPKEAYELMDRLIEESGRVRNEPRD